jgi:hypothetical protein
MEQYGHLPIYKRALELVIYVTGHFKTSHFEGRIALSAEGKAQRRDGEVKNE